MAQTFEKKPLRAQWRWWVVVASEAPTRAGIQARTTSACQGVRLSRPHTLTSPNKPLTSQPAIALSDTRGQRRHLVISGLAISPSLEDDVAAAPRDGEVAHRSQNPTKAEQHWRSKKHVQHLQCFDCKARTGSNPWGSIPGSRQAGELSGQKVPGAVEDSSTHRPVTWDLKADPLLRSSWAVGWYLRQIRSQRFFLPFQWPRP